MSKSRSSLVAALTSVSLLAACASTPFYENQQTAYSPQPVDPGARVYAEYGQVENIGTVQIAKRGGESGVGAILGAVIGGVVGNRFGAGTGRALATTAGVVGGGLAGNAVEKNRNERDGEVYRVQVRFEDGSVRSFDFQRIDDLRVGDRVKYQDGQIHRV